ncbi:chemosensory receptor B [Elysia marginata]|uniref:Chemosensory receptor B n=1 Tax=Elysia marginata TaxID=1093978 RepID=A0AAV4G1S2_9GAST|nr:chemosensory receptor B [Elysia marginata]
MDHHPASSIAMNISQVENLFHSSAYYMQLTHILNYCTGIMIGVYGFSVVANAIVIFVFFKDGFRSTSNISFFALGITDVLVGTIWTLFNVRIHPYLERPFYFIPPDVDIWKYIVLCADALASVGSWITAIITWERLCCIAFPLKVKRIFTRKLIICLILGGLTYEVLALTFYFTADYLLQQGVVEQVRFYEIDGRRFNKTVAVTIGQDLLVFARISLTYIPNYVLYSAIVLGTGLLIKVFLQSIETKQALTGLQGPTGMSTKEKKLVKSVLAICLVYLITCTPRNVYQTILIFTDEWAFPSIGRFVLQCTVDILLSFNQALNIFVYLLVNSSFRNQVGKLLGLSWFGDPQSQGSEINRMK